MLPIGLGAGAVLAYAMMLAGIGGLHDVDGISSGLAGIYALVAIVILWVLLAVLLVDAAIVGAMPVWARITAFVLHPVSLAATVFALVLLSSSGNEWVIVVPISLPPLIAGYALWTRLPILHALLPVHLTGGVVWGLVLILSLATLAGAIQHEKAVEAHKKAIPFISDDEHRDQVRRDRLASFEQLTATSSLDSYLQYLRRGDELRDRAATAVRQVEDRQDQAEAMLRRGAGLDIVRNFSVLDLQPTPSFCAAANDYLRRRAEDERPKGVNPTFWKVEDELEILMPGFEWLVAQHCEVTEALAEMEATVRAYPEASYAGNPALAAGRQTYLAQLARLRHAAPR